MLESLHVKNLALIEEEEIFFGDAFNILTGETGAGKSIILGAMNLLLGARADSKAILQDADKCTIEGVFGISGYGLETFFSEQDLEYDPDETILRRELSQSGKSRAFINDTPVSLTQLRDLACRLIDIHSQHRNLALGTESFQIEVVDTIARNEDVRTAYENCFDSARQWRCG